MSFEKQTKFYGIQIIIKSTDNLSAIEMLHNSPPQQ